MTTKEELAKWREVNDYFFSLLFKLEEKYSKGEITKQQKKKLEKKIDLYWDYFDFNYNPNIKYSPVLRKVAESIWE